MSRRPADGSPQQVWTTACNWAPTPGPLRSPWWAAPRPQGSATRTPVHNHPGAVLTARLARDARKRTMSRRTTRAVWWTWRIFRTTRPARLLLGQRQPTSGDFPPSAASPVSRLVFILRSGAADTRTRLQLLRRPPRLRPRPRFSLRTSLITLL